MLFAVAMLAGGTARAEDPALLEAALSGVVKDRGPDNGSKIDERLPEKLVLRGKVKEFCGYPIGLKEGFRLSFYWLAYESEYAHEPYDTPVYTRRGYYIGHFPSAFVFEL